MNGKLPPVLVSVEETVPHEWVEEFSESLHQTGLETEEEIREGGPAAGAEWLLPTAIVLVITSYLASMASEAGKDTYEALKKAIRRLAERVRERKVTRIASSPGKLSQEKPGQFTLALSDPGGMAIRFVLPADEEHAQEALELLLHRIGAEAWRQALFRCVEKIQKSGTAQWKIVGRFSGGAWQLYEPTTERTWSIDEETSDFDWAT